MARKSIPIDVERKLYAESMGRCMNPNCQAELFRKNGDVIEPPIAKLLTMFMKT